jgi:RimJ/RimL family protein N-acetyltransferase
MTSVVECRRYRIGDLAAIPCAEPAPFEGWLEFVEEHGHGLTSITLDGELIAVIGFTSCWDGVGDAFARVDRQKAAGHGRALATVVKVRILQVMQAYGIHRMQATSDATDRAGGVFLRAVGFRFESIMRQGAPDRSDLRMHCILWRPHDQQA